MIGPEIPDHISTNRSTTPDDDDVEGPPPRPAAPSIGPAIPPEVLARSQTAIKDREEDNDDDDDYAPALPPELAATRSAPSVSSLKAIVKGPTLPPSMAGPSYDDSDDDEVGPMPLPEGYVIEDSDGVREFMEKEERRRQQIEEAAKPKALKRDEWMLVPPSSSDLLGSIDPTKLTKSRQFARTAAPARDVDTSLWTETPAERQQRIADEVAGKRRRAANADPDTLDEGKLMEARKRRRRDEEIRKGVEEYTKKSRGGTLVEQHEENSSREAKQDEDDGPPKIWDHSRDMALGGRLMDDKTRNKFIQDARGLGDRFGSGKGGSFL